MKSTETSLFFLIKAFLSLVPRAELFSFHASNATFFFDFSLKTSLEESFFPLIEERARQYQSEADLKKIEMLASNAALYLSSLGLQVFSQLWSETKNPKSLAILLKDENFALPFENLEDKNFLSFFKLLSLKNLGNGLYRIEGAAFSDKATLKTFVKKWPALLKKDHLRLGEEMGFFTESYFPGEYIYSEKARVCFHLLKQIAEDFFSEEKIQRLDLPSCSQEKKIDSLPLSLFEKYDFAKQTLEGTFILSAFASRLLEAKRRKLDSLQLPFKLGGEQKEFRKSISPSFRGLFDTQEKTSMDATFFLLKKKIGKEAISSLQLIKKIAKILGFECEWKLIVGDKKSSKDPKDSLGERDFITKAFKDALDEEKLTYTVEKKDLLTEISSIEVDFFDLYGNLWPGCSLTYRSFRENALKVFWYEKSQGEKPEKGLSLRSSQKRLSPTRLFKGDPKGELAILALTLFSSLERTLAFLLEKDNGWLPLWLAPTTVRIAYRDGLFPLAKEAFFTLKKHGFRVELETEKDFGKSFQNVEKEKIPFLIIVDEEKPKNLFLKIRDVKNGLEERVFLSDWIEKMKALTELPKEGNLFRS